MTERQEFFRREMPVRVLVAEKHADDGGGGKGVEYERLLRKQKPQLVRNERRDGFWRRGGREAQAGQVTEDQRQPRAPAEKLQHHPKGKFKAVVVIHKPSVAIGVSRR